MTSIPDAKPTTAAGASAEWTAELIRVLLDVGNVASAVVAEVLAEIELTPSVAGVLWALAPGSAAPTMREIAAHLRCDPSTVSLTADKLEGMGLIARQPHPADGRKRILVLTERGHELWNALGARLHASGLFTGLDAEELITLHGLLTRVRRPQYS
jgi:DNA-binding MarR family transcriptional regulator